MSNLNEARLAIEEALDLAMSPNAGENNEFIRAQLRRARSALIPDVSEEIHGTIEERIMDSDERERLVKDRYADLCDAFGSPRFGGKQPAGPISDKLLERIARMEVAIETLSPEHVWVA